MLVKTNLCQTMHKPLHTPAHTRTHKHHSPGGLDCAKVAVMSTRATAVTKSVGARLLSSMMAVETLYRQEADRMMDELLRDEVREVCE